MTKKEAYQILGLEEGASKEEILANYQKLMKKNHPDLGGSDWITKKLNKAREILLGWVFEIFLLPFRLMSIIKKAIFPIAGLGTRFLPATKAIPKEMLTVLDRPVIEWAVIEAANSGIEEMIFVISSKKNSIIEHFDRSEILENILKKKK